MSETPRQPDSDRYLPDELELDMTDPADVQLYVESEGIRGVGVLLIEKRKLFESFRAGGMAQDTYDEFRNRLDTELAELWLLHNRGENPRP
jgi:hypothetical protein